VVEAYIAACASGEVATLLPLLDPSVIGWADVGGMLAAVSQPTIGRETVAQNVMTFLGASSGTTLLARTSMASLGIIALGSIGVW
jgi:hypothetical protein